MTPPREGEEKPANGKTVVWEKGRSINDREQIRAGVGLNAWGGQMKNAKGRYSTKKKYHNRKSKNNHIPQFGEKT